MSRKNCLTLKLCAIALIASPAAHAAVTATELPLYAFGSSDSDGAYPYAVIQGKDGNFYGVTDDDVVNNNNGTIFEYDVSTATESILDTFGSSPTDGNYPLSLIQGSDGNFYGAAQTAGANGDGTFFEYNVAAATETTLASFGSAAADGAYPYSVIQGSDGNFYGVAQTAGAYGEGTIFEYDVTTASEITLASFGSSAADGADPLRLIQGSDGNFYGVSQLGGANNQGTLFEYNVTAQTETTLASFGSSSTDGAQPVSLIQGSDGNFYGVTQIGGANGDGTIFEFNVKAGTETALASLGSSSTDGIRPMDLVQGSDGNLYGVAQLGGANSAGTAFEYALPAGPETTLVAFGSSPSDGVGPHDIILGKDGNFYGVTQLGGDNGNLGTFYQIVLTSSASGSGSAGPSAGAAVGGSADSGSSGGGSMQWPELLALLSAAALMYRKRPRAIGGL